MQGATPYCLFDSRNTWNIQYTLRGAAYGMQNAMELRHSCLMVATHEASFTSGRAVYGMQNAMELRHAQCAEQQKSPSITLRHHQIIFTHETSSTMRGATGVTLQLHRILRLLRRMTLMIDPRHTSNVQYNARSSRSHPPTSPNIAPATKNVSHDWSSSHIKRPVQCAEQQEPPSNFLPLKKWLSWLILVRHETSSTIRGATEVTLQLHQIFTWDVQYNAWGIRSHLSTSPNSAPARKNDSHD